jgi:hypothetical protein
MLEIQWPIRNCTVHAQICNFLFFAEARIHGFFTWFFSHACYQLLTTSQYFFEFFEFLNLNFSVKKKSYKVHRSQIDALVALDIFSDWPLFQLSDIYHTKRATWLCFILFLLQDAVEREKTTI